MSVRITEKSPFYSLESARDTGVAYQVVPLCTLTQKAHAFQGRFPYPSQFFTRLQEGIPFRKHKHPTACHHVRVQLSRQVSKHSFCTITSDCIPESLPNNDPHACGSIAHRAGEKIEEIRRNSAAMTFDRLDITGAP